MDIPIPVLCMCKAVVSLLCAMTALLDLVCGTACFNVFASNSATVDIKSCVGCITVTRMCRGVNVRNSHAMCTFLYFKF